MRYLHPAVYSTNRLRTGHATGYFGAQTVAQFRTHCFRGGMCIGSELNVHCMCWPRVCSKYVQFPIICSLQYSININTVDPNSDLLHTCIVKPKNTDVNCA